MDTPQKSLPTTGQNGSSTYDYLQNLQPLIEALYLVPHQKPLGEKVETQKPTIGRTVLYHKYGTPNGEHKPEPSPAVITKVIDDSGKCQLFVMNPNGLYFNETPYAQEPTPGHWSWPLRN